MKWLNFFLILLCITSFVYAEEIRWDDLVQAIITCESNGDPNAVSEAGAVGLMQITPIVLKEFNDYGYMDEPTRKEYLYCPVVNVKIGTWYLMRLKDHYKCPTIECVLASYNGGITRLRRNKWDIEKMSSETREYVEKVMKLYRR